MPDYDGVNFRPPAPVATVTLRSLAAKRSIPDVVMLIDSGADMTLLPRSAVERLGVSPLEGQHVEVEGFDGSRSFAPVVELDAIFLSRAYRGRYALIDEETGIMGRDILNHVALLLHGPRQVWSEQRSD